MKIRQWMKQGMGTLLGLVLVVGSPIVVAQAATTSSSANTTEQSTSSTEASSTASSLGESSSQQPHLLLGPNPGSKEPANTGLTTTTSDDSGDEGKTPDTTYTGMIDFSGNVSDKASIVGTMLILVNQATGAKVEMTTGLNSQGQTAVNALPYGSYEVDIQAAPDGYVGRTGSQGTVTVDQKGGSFAGAIQTFKGSLLVSNVTANGKALAGTTLTLTNTSNSTGTNQQTASADAQGRVQFANLGPGTYELTATQASNGYLLNTEVQTFEIPETAANASQVAVTKIWKNYQGSAALKVVNPEGQPLAGVLFDLKNPNGTNQQYETDASGTIQLANLASGVYTFTQKKANANYLLNQHVISFKVGSEANGDPGAVALSNFINYPGSISFQNVTSDKQVLLGASFQVTNTTTHQQMTLQTKDALKSYTVLGPGSYTMKQVTAPTGYILNQTVLHFVIPTQATDEPAAVPVEQFTNYQGAVSGSKVSEDEKPLANTEFELIDSKTGKVIGTVRTDKAGEFKITGIPPGEYRLRESKATKGYIKNTTTYPVTIPTTAKGKPATVRVVKSYGYRGSVKITVTDAVANHLVPSGLYEITGPNGFKKRMKANENGELALSNLPPGTYTIRQLTAADGYKKTTKEWTVTISSSEKGLPDQEVVKAKIVPKSKTTDNESSSAEDATDSTSVSSKAGGEASASSAGKASMHDSMVLWGGLGALALVFVGIGLLMFYLMKREQEKKHHEG